MIADEKIGKIDNKTSIVKWEYDFCCSGKGEESLLKSVPGLNSFGEQGFELVSVVPSIKEGRVEYYFWVFKRPRGE